MSKHKIKKQTKKANKRLKEQLYCALYDQEQSVGVMYDQEFVDHLKGVIAKLS